MEVSSGTVLVDQKVNVCNMNVKSLSGLITRPLMETIERSANFKIKCPFKKNFLYKFKSVDLKSFYFSSLLKPNAERELTLTMMEGKKANPIFAVTFYFMKIEVDD